MVSGPVTGEVESRILVSLLSAGPSTTPALTDQLGLTTSATHTALVRLVQAGMVDADDGTVTLTSAGRWRARELKRFPDGPPPNVASIDLGDLGKAVGALWPSAAAQAVAEDRRRDELLAADTDRDAAVHLLAEALAQGRLSATEFDERTDRALAARTYGDLDDVLHGLGGLPRQVRSHPVRKVVFWVVAALSAPFLFLGSMALLFGSDAGDRVFGIVIMVLLLPGLLALRRWTLPRS